LFNGLCSVLRKAGTESAVHLRLNIFFKCSTVRGASDWYDFTFVVNESDNNFNIAFNIDLILDKVLAIVHILDFTRDFFLFLVGCLNCNHKSFSTRFPIFTIIISGLDHEFNWLADGLLFKKTGTKGKRL
jgi:hypothetical protein